jgi:phenylacetate-coenzyme A ligase PaaK-like adenylate-forming protein
VTWPNYILNCMFRVHNPLIHYFTKDKTRIHTRSCDVNITVSMSLIETQKGRMILFNI